MPGIDFAAVRAAISIRQVLDFIAFVPSERRGSQWRGPCPVHRSENPRGRSFSVNLSKGAFRCFHCGAQGNQLDLWRLVHQVSLVQTCCELCHRANIPVPYLTSSGQSVHHRDSTNSTEKRNP